MTKSRTFMEEPRPSLETIGDAPRGLTRADFLRLGLLLLLATLLHGWLIANTVAVPRDGVDFIRYALQLERRPWREVMGRYFQHPLYPMTILATSLPVRGLLGTNCETMRLSAQIAAAIAAVLLVIPTYLLGRMLFDRRVGFWASALFQCLPVTARVTSDTLSDALCLFLVATALYLGLRAMRSRSAWRFAGCGLCAGLAYLARPEGILPAAAVGVVLLAVQMTKMRRPWRQVAVEVVSLSVAAVLVAGPFVAVTGRLTTKPTARSVLQGTEQVQQSRLTTGPLLAVTWMGPAERGPSLLWGLGALTSETIRAYQYLGWLPALVGLWWFRARFRGRPEAWVLGVFCIVFCVILVRMSLVVGYLSERHVQMLVFCGSFWAVALLAKLGDYLAVRGGWRWTAPALLAAATVFALPILAKPLHANQAGHRTAGLWLAAHRHSGDEIIDWHNCACYYAGNLFLAPAEPTPASLVYVVREEPKLIAPPVPWQRRVDEVIEQGNVVFRCPAERGKAKGQEIVIYAGKATSAPRSK
jgi:4-amino-4-deoxy-L-arabinose transferase-like glycosyltransferase